MSSKGPFPRARAAREALRGKAVEIYEQYHATIQKAIDAGELEVAMENMRWLLEHMPADEDGTKLLDPSVDKGAVEKGSSGPNIQIGIALGGVKPTHALAPAPTHVQVIDVTNESDSDTEA